MNRIILVGNGFDLAHGLKTKYEDFINWYWNNWRDTLKNATKSILSDELIEINTNRGVGYINRYFWNIDKTDNVYKYICDVKINKGRLINIKISPLLERISKSIEEKGWTDIERDYYEMLQDKTNEKEVIINLNKDFEIIRQRLIQYLRKIQEEEISKLIIEKDIKDKMFAPFSKEEIAKSSKGAWKSFVIDRADEASISKVMHILHDYERFSIKTDDLKNILKKEETHLILDENFNDTRGELFLFPDRILLLNFNYTNTANLYLSNSPRFIINHIHGDLNSPQNIIFGYGDESDDEYKKALKLNDNEYLRYIKTIRYLETTHYRELLDFIESDTYQVCIMGHSCGLSDKTMLNTLFEHKNCVSIKPYYYVDSKGKDNYLDIVQNISRNFTDMKLMRDRVVNKTYCKTLS